MMKQLIIVILCLPVLLLAQETSVSSGGDATSSSGSMSYSIGQLSYTTVFSETGSLSQGIQQGYSIEVTTSTIDQTVQLFMNTYPNPVAHNLVLYVETNDQLEWQYNLYDAAGKLHKKGAITGSITSIKVVELPATNYILTVVDEQNLLKSFKITKIN